MKRLTALPVAVLCCAASLMYADYKTVERGEWPKSWPRELEPLRKKSRTLVGNEEPNRHYAMRFTNRDEFESAWPHILKVKCKGAPLRLVRGANFYLGGDCKAGVVVQCPPRGQSDEAAALALVVDGEIVDLNRIPLPADTPIIDERFQERPKKSPERNAD